MSDVSERFGTTYPVTAQGRCFKTRGKYIAVPKALAVLAGQALALRQHLTTMDGGNAEIAGAYFCPAAEGLETAPPGSNLTSEWGSGMCCSCLVSKVPRINQNGDIDAYLIDFYPGDAKLG